MGNQETSMTMAQAIEYFLQIYPSKSLPHKSVVDSFMKHEGYLWGSDKKTFVLEVGKL